MPLVMTEIWLIRHGESESNAGLPTSDTAKIALTPRGFAQAESIVPAFVRPLSLIVTSPYLRAQQSAQPTIKRFPQARLAEWPVHEYTYLSLGNRHGTTLQDRRPLVEAYWERADPQHVDGDGAESFIALVARAAQILDRIKHLEDDFVAIFSHGLFIRTMIWVLLTGSVKIDAVMMRRYRSFIFGFSIPNASILKLYVNGEREVFFSNIMMAHLPTFLI